MTRNTFMRIVGLAALAVAALPQVTLAQTGAAPLKIGMIGSGREGGALGKLFVKSVNAQGGAGLVTAKWLPGSHIVRAFNAIGSGRLAENAQRPEKVGVPIAGDDPKAIAAAEALIREIGFEPVLVGGLAMGRHLVPGTPLAGEHTPAEIRQAAAGL